MSKRRTANPKKAWRVEVEWQDSQLFGGGWQPVGSFLNRRASVTCYTVGIVIGDDARGMVLASSVNGRNASGVVVIPRRQIVRSRRLR